MGELVGDVELARREALELAVGAALALAVGEAGALVTGAGVGTGAVEGWAAVVLVWVGLSNVPPKVQ